MNNLRCAFLCLCSLLCTILSAQTVKNKDEKAEINRIKKSGAYLYEETTLPDAQDAIDLAEEMLYEKINQFVADNRKFDNARQIVTLNTNYSVEQITLPRGNMYRAFMYVKKTDILPSQNVQVTTIEPKTQNLNATYEEQPTTTTTSVSSPDIQAEVINTLLRLRRFSELSSVLPQLKREGKISEYARYSDLANANEYMLVVYNRDGDIEAILSDGPDRINLATGQDDSTENYKGRGALGVKMNKNK